jgi:hypothetical protein
MECPLGLLRSLYTRCILTSFLTPEDSVRFPGPILSAAFLTIVATLTAQAPKRSLIAPQVGVRVPVPPTAFKADGAWHLVYELRLGNMSPATCQVSRVEVATRVAISWPRI